MSNRKSFSPGALTAPLPPAIVTVGDGERDNMLTVAWTGILATVPPKTYISVRPSRHSYGLLKKSGEFVINLPSADMAKTVDFVGIYTGAKMDKFERTGLTRAKSERVAAPTVAECPVALECRVSEVLTMGSHDVFIADILSVSCREELLDAEGKLHFERANLLAYMHGEYYSLGECLGKFGFSTKKDKKSQKRATRARQCKTRPPITTPPRTHPRARRKKSPSTLR
jgi:flavin reductase (DIM6/NTAB) family NADH-FMN oxidoreductase RutF